MILTIIILFFGLIALIKGYHRGFVNELLKLAGAIIALVLATGFADQVGLILRSFFRMFVSNDLYYNHALWHGIGFFITFMIVLMIVHAITRLLDGIVSLPILRQLNSILGAVTSLIISLLVMTIIIDVLLLFKVEWITLAYQDSTVAQLLVSSLGQIFTL
ncbi:CvpA family protein [Fructilactobacillus sp. Tb1]|uniref:CvpA family protein n=1 Tax=Fructilactobacillus sp. Tb1 TaxID=3422304 RepID=UPI003D2BD0D9